MYWTIYYEINNLKMYYHVYWVKEINFKPLLKEKRKKKELTKFLKIIPAIFDKHDLNRTCRMSHSVRGNYVIPYRRKDNKNVHGICHGWCSVYSALYKQKNKINMSSAVDYNWLFGGPQFASSLSCTKWNLSNEHGLREYAKGDIYFFCCL